ncbi:MAG: PilZ domain-containing protein [Acidobacteriota bacterium]
MEQHDDRDASAPGLQSGAPDSADVSIARKVSILIVEADAVARSTEASCFERLGCIVHPAGCFEEALEAARTATLDIALLCERSLGDDPGAACESLRQASGRDELPIVLISEEDAPEALDPQRASGCRDYVPRSVAQMDLVRRVANILQIPPRRFLRTMVAQVATDSRAKAEYLGHSRDISCTGILIETSRRLSVDEVLQLKFLLPHSNSLINASAQVTRILRNPLSGQYEVGCRFTEIAPSVQKIIGEFLAQDLPRF